MCVCVYTQIEHIYSFIYIYIYIELYIYINLLQKHHNEEEQQSYDILIIYQQPKMHHYSRVCAIHLVFNHVLFHSISYIQGIVKILQLIGLTENLHRTTKVDLLVLPISRWLSATDNKEREHSRKLDLWMMVAIITNID